jgi:hypothetical protein
MAEEVGKTCIARELCVMRVAVLTCLRHFQALFAELQEATINLVAYARPRGTTGLLLDAFSWNLMFENFSKICRYSSSLKCDKINEYFSRRPVYIYDHISLNSS